MNETTKMYKKKTLTIDVCLKLFDFLAGFLCEIRDLFDNYQTVSIGQFPDSDYRDSHRRIKKSDIRSIFPDESISFTGR